MSVEEKDQTANNKFSLEQTIEKLGDCFVRNNNGKLYKFILEAVEKPLIENVLDKTRGNQSKVAKILGINRNTLHSKIKKLGIEIARWKKS